MRTFTIFLILCTAPLATLANADTFRFTFTRAYGNVGGTVEGLVTLEDPCTLSCSATSLFITSVPSPFSLVSPSILTNVFAWHAIDPSFNQWRISADHSRITDVYFDTDTIGIFDGHHEEVVLKLEIGFPDHPNTDHETALLDMYQTPVLGIPPPDLQWLTDTRLVNYNTSPEPVAANLITLALGLGGLAWMKNRRRRTRG